MTNLKYGSSGEEVTKLQNALISAGYDVGSTGADGVYGTNTQAAVKAYQKANGLSVDGIAGENTLNSLYGTNTTSSTPASGTTTNTATTTTTPEASTTPSTTSGFKYNEFTYEDYAPSDAVNQANALLQQQQANNPGSYSPVWKNEADSYLSQYQNRDPFSYNFNEDALYNQYKDNYIRQGQMAMMDTMGQAAALTGGYGNSYAQSVGQQAYQGYLQELNNVVPELWQLARENYDREGQDLLTMYDLYMNKENQEYNQYQDSMDRWYQEMARLQDNYDTLYNREYSEYEDKRNMAYDQYNADRDVAWNEYLRDLENQQTAAELLASTGNYDRLQEIYGLTDEEIAAIKKANTKSTGGTGTKKNTKTTLSLEEQQKWAKEFGSADDIGDVEWAADKMAQAGVDPQIIAQWYDKYAAGFQQKVDTNVNDLPAQNQANNRLTGGGGGYKSILDRITY